MTFRTVLITALLGCAVAPAFGQTPVPIVTPNRTETFAYVTDGRNSNFPLKWDVYLPTSNPPWNAVLVIFGGRFSGGNRQTVGGIASYLASQGFVALAIDYRTDMPNSFTGQQVPVYAPPASPNQPGDVKLAVKAARTGIIPGGGSLIEGNVTGKVGAVGGSSGASHALWCAATGDPLIDKLDAAVLFSGAYKFDDQASLNWQPDPHECLFVDTFCEDVTLYCQTSGCTVLNTALHDGSPIYQVGADVSPLYWVSDPGDSITPFQFLDLKNWLQSFHRSRGFTWVWLNQAECNHSFDNWPAEQDEVSNWLHLRLDGSL